MAITLLMYTLLHQFSVRRSRSSVGRALDSPVAGANVPVTKDRGSKCDGPSMFMRLLTDMAVIGGRPIQSNQRGGQSYRTARVDGRRQGQLNQLCLAGALSP